MEPALAIKLRLKRRKIVLHKGEDPDVAKLRARLKGRKMFAQKSEKPTAGKLNIRSVRGTRTITVNRAKMLTSEQFDTALEKALASPHAERNAALLLLSFYCGLRAQELAGLRWKRHILNSDGTIADNLFVTHEIGKNPRNPDSKTHTREAKLPIVERLRSALEKLRALRPKDVYVIYPLYKHTEKSERASFLDAGQTDPNTVAQYLRRLYDSLGFIGASSHSGRRTFITMMARHCNEVGSSLRDVQLLARHASLDTTAGYITPSERHYDLANTVFQ